MNHTIAPFSFQYTRSNAGLSLKQPLHVEANRIIWLVGNSGSGKSTFLHLLKGFYPEFIAGQLQGEPPNHFNDAAYVAQNPLSQMVHEHVGEEFFFSMENNNWPQERMQVARHWLTRFSLQDQEYEATENLSHGQSQRLLLASMLACEPSWVLFDEPTAFLNIKMRDDFYTMLQQLKGQVGMVLIDHHPHAAELADECWHVSDDGIISSLTVAQWQAMQTQALAEEQQTPSVLFHSTPLPHAVQLTAHQLTIGYSKKTLFTANFTLNAGECAVLVGDNGAGKSTLFNTLAGIQKPLHGSFTLSLDHMPVKKNTSQMSYVFQHPDSHFYFDTIAEELSQLGIEQPDFVLEQMKLAHMGAYSPHQLSEGQKRRLSLLYPCLQQRPLILLDEPTFGQDLVNTQRIINLMQQLKQSGHALIVITHDAAVQQAIATHIWTIKNAQLTTTTVNYS